MLAVEAAGGRGGEDGDRVLDALGDVDLGQLAEEEDALVEVGGEEDGAQLEEDGGAYAQREGGGAQQESVPEPEAEKEALLERGQAERGEWRGRYIL